MAKEQPNKAKPAGKNSQEPKKPKFSPYWIYAGIILIFLGIQFFAGGGFNEPSKQILQSLKPILKMEM